MKHWSTYKNHDRFCFIRKNEIYDNTIYTFDIETTSILLKDDNTILNTEIYNTLTDKEKKHITPLGFMYIWQFSINDIVYYGRTWGEYQEFLKKVFPRSDVKSTIWVHNLAFESAFLTHYFNITKVFARQTHKPFYIEMENIRYRCSYLLTDCSLEKLTEIYQLPLEKKKGDLDYTKIRTHETKLTKTELKYCEYDCLVVYELIKKLLLTYKYIIDIPLSSTGILRYKVKKNISKLFYKHNREIISTNPYFYNRLVEAMSGGYVHSNSYYTDEVLHDIDSWDENSAYPFAMCCMPVFPQKPFELCKFTNLNNLSKNHIYIMVLKFTNIQSKKENTVISMSKCRHLLNHTLDNGRILSADTLEITCTNFDYEIYQQFYKWEKIECLELWYSPKGYLPRDYIAMILEDYKIKTEIKGVPEREYEYNAIRKPNVNKYFGMTCTNDIKPEIIFNNDTKEWEVEPLTNKDIEEKLISKKKKGFLDFSYGVFITSIMRFMLLKNVSQLDTYTVYDDTDSIKLRRGYNKHIIHCHNISVLKQVRKAKKKLKLSGFCPKDIKGRLHPLGIFEYEENYTEFITQGSKKYAYKTKDDKIKITVSGVPKKGAVSITDLSEFKNGYVFMYQDTGKLSLYYNTDEYILKVTDYLNCVTEINFKGGVSLVPCDYTLGKSIDYESLLFNIRSKFK